MKLKEVSRKFTKLRNRDAVIDCLTTKEFKESGYFVDQYKSWVVKQSRGSLLFPIPSFYLLIREFDTIFRKCQLSGGSVVMSINKEQLHAAMLDAFMVKYYCHKIIAFAHEQETDSLPALNYLICLFITIKGFAIARKVRNRLTKCNKKTQVQNHFVVN